MRASGETYDPALPFTRAIAKIENGTQSWVIDVGGFIGGVGFRSLYGPDQRAQRQSA